MLEYQPSSKTLQISVLAMNLSPIQPCILCQFAVVGGNRNDLNCVTSTFTELLQLSDIILQFRAVLKSFPTHLRTGKIRPLDPIFWYKSSVGKCLVTSFSVKFFFVYKPVKLTRCFAFAAFLGMPTLQQNNGLLSFSNAFEFEFDWELSQLCNKVFYRIVATITDSIRHILAI